MISSSDHVIEHTLLVLGYGLIWFNDRLSAIIQQFLSCIF